MKKILIIILSIALITGCTNNSADIRENEVQEAVNETQETNDEAKANEPVMAPDFELESMDGSIIKLSETRVK
ncbi:MAG TPA: hypothetical protein PLD67_07690, partial [Sedimentibacter sp.]|nr:hypothetical protein [Sedimentibacter sp.]